ncbi:hypothetical protein V5036_18200 [Enterobacter cloacae]|uniref:tail fiber/spike domain-containing protein n=1 Tax=Enterobacter cloacae TaxID=550 RepID=UPI0030763E7D
MTTYATNNPLGSTDPRDLYDNSQNFDNAMNNLEQAFWVDRFGIDRRSWFGIEEMVAEAAAKYGFIILSGKTFATGATVNLNEILLDTASGEYFQWTGSFPEGGKIVPPGSTPDSTGGQGPGKWKSVGDSALRSLLASVSGAGMIGYDPSTDYAAGTIGYELNKKRKNVVYATADGGIPNDGSDVSTQVSAFLNANKGKFIVFDSGTYMFAGVVLSGSGWEGTTIYFKGKHLLKPDTTGTNTPGYGGFIGLILTKTVNDLTLYYRGDGNRTLQYNREHIFNVAIYGSTNLSIPYFKCDEIRGDGLYINSEDQTSSSAQNATNINIGTVLGRNSSIDGRNLISVVSCNRGNIKSFISENIGGVVGGFQQPGGLDVEPNNLPGCLVRDFVIEYASSVGAGGVYLVADWSASPAKIQNCHVLKATVRGGQKIRMYGATQSSINGECISVTGDSAAAAEGNTSCTMTVRAITCTTGALIGTQSTNFDCKFSVFARGISNAGVITGGLRRSDLDLDFDDWVVGGNLIGLWYRDLNNVGSLIQNGNRVKIRCPKTTNVTRAVQYTPGTSPITFSGDNILYDSIFTDWPTFDVILGAAGQYLTKEGKMPFLTTANGVPSNGSWKQGDFVYYSNPSTTNKFYGFYRITTGSGNVNGTDWGTVVFS